jgi:hypothetical protein
MKPISQVTDDGQAPESQLQYLVRLVSGLTGNPSAPEKLEDLNLSQNSGEHCFAMQPGFGRVGQCDNRRA